MRATMTLAGFCLLLSACGNSKGSSQPSAQPSFPVAQGSGAECPRLEGNYECTVTNEEKAEGKRVHRMMIKNGRDEKGFPQITVTQPSGSQDYVTNGKIVVNQYKDGTVIYSVDCNERQMAIHAVSDKRFDIQTKLILVGRSSILVASTGKVGDTTIDGTRRCTRALRR